MQYRVILHGTGIGKYCCRNINWIIKNFIQTHHQWLKGLTHLNFTRNKLCIQVTIKLIECLSQFFLCLPMGLHYHSLEVHWETVPM